MRNIVKALRGIGYQVIASRLDIEDKAVWSSMVASAISAQQSVNISDEDKVWWNSQVESETCPVCYLHGEQFCSSHN